ncbi:MAG: hypothetical protein NTX50_10125 [Candidatus Sumerlaeota bacterium]|nr:hypothetical protein [Candidatus Sumerlaeota bacterium]
MTQITRGFFNFIRLSSAGRSRTPDGTFRYPGSSRVPSGVRDLPRVPSGVRDLLIAALFFATMGAYAQENLLKNPGFEDAAPSPENPPNWSVRADSAAKATLTDKEAHGGRQCISIPARSTVEQKVVQAQPGAYLARCWIKSEADQTVTFLIQDTDRPWVSYTYAEIKTPKSQWTLVEAFCAVEQTGTLTLTLGGLSKEARSYQGSGGDMAAPILADDFELVRREPKTPPRLSVWDPKQELGAGLDFAPKNQWLLSEGQSHIFFGTPVFQIRHLAGFMRKDDGSLAIYAAQGRTLKPRGVIAPTPAFKVSQCEMVQANGRTGIRVASEKGGRSYTAWLNPKGVISIESTQIASFIVQQCQLRYGLLPSFIGTDICYAPQKLYGLKQVSIPSTQWFVGLGESGDNMMVAVWDSDSQAVSLGLSGQGENRLIDSFNIATDKAGFSLSFVEHANLWHKEPLNEDWLGEYTTIKWERPFQARWMGHFNVTPASKPTFRDALMEYSFPVANAKTRMWGVWFENWNFYPFFFDGPRTVVHFEKAFVPNGDALFYFLEPAAADLYSPCEIVEQALGKEKAAALFDFDASRLRKLKYSTPDNFIYDRPVCATTTHLTKIKKEEKATVGMNLATHLYEFIREIRGRVDQYAAFFEQTEAYLKGEKARRPELQSYLTELESMVTDARTKTQEIYATPLSAVEKKTEAIKKALQESKADGFDFGPLDVRGTAGAQDDLCRRYNRLVIRLMQAAALKCGDSPEGAAIAKHIWDQSRLMLRQPTRWESRRTLAGFEP